MIHWQYPAAGYDAQFEPLVAVTRGESVESVHRGALVVSDASGRLLGGAGDPAVVVGLRSTAKPFQALALLEAGAAEAFDLADQELAVICASHSGDEEHLALVQAILERAGAGPADLACGPQAPLSQAARERLSGRPPSPMHNMCSGKHAGMILLARHLGAPVGGYERTGHPVQQAIARTIGQLAGVPRPGLIDGRDGCGVPVVRLSLAGTARLYALLAAGATDDLARLRRAMSRYPLLVSGRGRLDAELTQALDDGSLSKSGADGVQALALADPCLGVALKVEDGSHRPVAVLLGAVLESWGRLEGQRLVEKHAQVTTRGGEPAGRIVCLLEERRLRRSWPSSGGQLPSLRIVHCDGRERDINRFRQEEWPRADEEILGRTYEWTAHRFTLAARDKKDLVGLLTASYIGGVATLEELLVRRDKRGHGVGSTLLGKFEEDARERGSHKIVLRTPLGARAESFYLQHGYHRECLLARHHFEHDYLSLRKDLF